MSLLRLPLLPQPTPPTPYQIARSQLSKLSPTELTQLATDIHDLQQAMVVTPGAPQKPGTLLYAWELCDGDRRVSPQSICFWNGRLYVTDLDNSRVCVFKPEGDFLFAWGKKGASEGEFSCPYGICALSGLIYVTDGDNRRVQVFNEMGEFIKQWGEDGSKNGEYGLYGPSAIYAITTSTGVDRVFINAGNRRCQICDTSGVLLGLLGGSEDPSPAPSIPSPSGFAYDGDGRLYTAGHKSIDVFDEMGGRLIESLPIPDQSEVGSPMSVCLVNKNRIGVLFQDRHCFELFDLKPSFKCLGRWGEEGKDRGQFEYPSQIISVEGRIFVADSENNRIQVFTA